MGSQLLLPYLLIAAALLTLLCATALSVRRALKVREPWHRKMIFSALISTSFILPVTVSLTANLIQDRWTQQFEIEKAQSAGARIDRFAGPRYEEVHVRLPSATRIYRLQNLSDLLFAALQIQVVSSAALFMPSYLILRLVKPQPYRPGFRVIPIFRRKMT